MANRSLAHAELHAESRQNGIITCKLFVLVLLSSVWGFAVLLNSSVSTAGKQNLPVQRPTIMMPSASQLAGKRFRGWFARSGQAVQNNIYGSSMGPFGELAILAIRANRRSNQLQDISMQAATIDDTGLVNELASLDRPTMEQIANMSETVRLKARDMAGVSAPLGFFDPLGFSTDIPEGKLLFYREVELKHGRVAMLAALGILVSEQFHPLFGGNIDVPAYIAFQNTPLQTFWQAVVLAIAIPEVFSVLSFDSIAGKRSRGVYIPPTTKRWWSMRSDRVPGDLGFDPLGLKPTDPGQLKEMQTKELNNGRLAMIAAAGMLAQELVTRQKIF